MLLSDFTFTGFYLVFVFRLQAEWKEGARRLERQIDHLQEQQLLMEVGHISPSFTEFQ